MKVFLLVAFLLITGSAFSQLTKGALLVEGSGSFDFSKSKDDAPGILSNENNNFQLSVRPSVGVMISEKWMVGSGLRYDYNSSSTEYDANNITQTSEQTSHSFLLNVFLRRYAQLNEKLYFMATLTTGGGFGKIKRMVDYQDADPETTTYNTYQANVSLTPGLTYLVSNKWAITGSVGQVYANFNWRNIEDEESKNFNSSAGLNFQLNTFSIGVQYFLRNGTE